MPTYSYRCTECERAFDIVQAFTDDTLTVCPTCGGKLRKVFSPVGVSFNGSGFYRTDSRSGSTGGATSAAPKTESSSSSTEKSAPKKDATKPAASTGSSSGSTTS
ncbi:zinc ribbon domain-containing protein [Salinibacterium sp. G-O1]|uniref:FmdB family zinc ribbon protein n=1 Tax=Salinibacterium sp. G-O1 TaxID=3046208 RepID=UPI0024BB30DD|nr:FmdB family zinc ribbon protein [Salinibacterium sp. G-O1]MDJ0336155.1 zinc ribbon domain-containing protein [Salinibacterium sp. G-O1]